MQRSDEAKTPGAMVVDPVCGKPLLALGVATVRLDHAGQTWHFCGPACLGRFARLAEHAVLDEALRAGRLLRRGARARWGTA
jgi:YHS domain-containing protein